MNLRKSISHAGQGKGCNHEDAVDTVMKGAKRLKSIQFYGMIIVE